MKKENTIENELPVKKPSVMYATKIKDDEVEETFDCNECGETTYIEEHSYNNGMCHNCIKEK